MTKTHKVWLTSKVENVVVDVPSSKLFSGK